MRLYLNDLTEKAKKCTELNETMICMSGHDKPKYVDPRSLSAGDLGFDTWIEHFNKPTFNTDAGGTGLTEGKFYSLLVVPVDADVVGFDDFQRGTPTRPAIPQVSVASGQGITFNIPLHAQDTTYGCGYEDTGATGTVTDASQDWADDQWIDFRVRNIEDGTEAVITDNDATTLTAAGFVIGADERFEIVKAKCTRRDIYAVEMTAAADLSASTFIFQGTVQDNTTTTYTLDIYIAAGESAPFTNVPPERYSHCIAADNRVFAGGGITNNEGKASAVIAEETAQATGSANEEIVVTLITDLYSGAGNGRVMRYTLGSALTPFTELYIGSYVTITDSADGGNDIEDAQVLRIASDNTWIEITNNNGVADASDQVMLITLTPNVIKGNASGADQTYFSEGMLFGTFQFDDEIGYGIGWIDPFSQTMTLSQKYTGATTTDTAFTIETSYDLAWSDYGNPHVWRSENSTAIADKIIGIEIFRGLILVFCKRSLWKIPLSNLYQTPSLVTDAITFDSPFSIVSTPNGVMFYDGSGFSITDGQVVRSVTQYKATDFLKQINPLTVFNIKGVYDSVNRRVEYVFPYGTDVTNNTGIYITIDSFNIYPFTRLDCNAVWEDEDDDNRPIIKHGTSGRHVLTGSGRVYTHPVDQPTDGDFGDSATGGTITEVNSDHVVITGFGAITLGEGTICLHYPDGDGFLVSFIAKDITTSGGDIYEVYFSDDWYSAGFEVGGTILFTVIPFSYGIKWMDFGSPQYQHKVRQVQIDVTNFTGALYIEHFGDLNEFPIQIDRQLITPSITKVVIPLRKGSYYTYGFRLRGYSSTQANILSFEVLFDTEI